MPRLTKICVLLVFVCAMLMATSVPTLASTSPKSCSINFNGSHLRAPKGGGATIQSFTVNNDCSVTQGSIKTLLPGTPEFRAFMDQRRSHIPSKGTIDPGCDSELDYTDVAGLILTFTWLEMNFGYDPFVGQVTSVGPYFTNYGAALDGWSTLSTSFSPWTGPIPWGTVSSSFNGTFSWIAGSFWHSGTNHNDADGFGVCTGWPSEIGSTVPGGNWVFGVWTV